MPVRGGAAGKAGDTYEALWTVDAAIRIIRGEAESMVYESLDEDESIGVEFHIKTTQKETEYWSVKRQTTGAAGWTLSKLTTPKTGEARSILGDLAGHIERDRRNIAVFASTLASPELEEFRSICGDHRAFQQRLEKSGSLKRSFETYLLPVFQSNEERTLTFLNRLRIRTVGEDWLCQQLESILSLLFYSETNSQLDPSEVRRLLAEFLLDHVHRRIDREMLLGHLICRGYRLRDWKLDTSTRDRVATLGREYTEPILRLMVGGKFQTLPGAEGLLDSNGLPSLRALVCGPAESGKSTLLAQLVDQLNSRDIPILPIRFDELGEGILTSQDLGTRLALPASPVVALVGLADGGDCVLAIDQLDAVSLTSGRRTELWALFEKIMSEANRYPKLRVVLSCREFDLKHDHRIQQFSKAVSGLKTILLQPLSSDTVDDVLDSRVVHRKLKPILSVPLHLSMFLALEAQDGQNLHTRTQLFEAFWKRKLRNAKARKAGYYVEAIDALCDWLSEHQELSAPEHILDNYHSEADVLASENILVRADKCFRFFHESFFDYAYSRSFIRDDRKSLQMALLCGEQHLFRRAQVRQVLSFLRSADRKRYLSEVKTVLSDEKIRFHIKRTILRWLETVDSPTIDEWRILQNLSGTQPAMKEFVHRTVANHAEWFDTLDTDGFFEEHLSSEDSAENELAIWFVTMPRLLETRSARLAELLRGHRRDNESWRTYLQAVCRNGRVYHSQEMFELFLSLIKDGTLDGVRPGFAVNDTWWSTLFPVAHKAPEMACEALAVWFERVLRLWREEESASNGSSDYDRIERLRRILDGPGDHAASTVEKAAKAPEIYVQYLLPIIAGLCVELVGPPGRDLDRDPLSPCRGFGGSQHGIYDSVFANLAIALEYLAKDSPQVLDRYLDPFIEHQLEPIVYLTLRAWTANPTNYADRLMKYVIDDPRRLEIGYFLWSGKAGDGVPGALRSIRAVEAASPFCSRDLYSDLEKMILSCSESGESSYEFSVPHQYQLLNALASSRRSSEANSRIEELESRLPGITSEPPEPWGLFRVGPPFSTNELSVMTDEQWLAALEEFAGVENSRNPEISKSGGERELANSLEEKTKTEPQRFLMLSARMPLSLPSSYFDAIIRGLANVQASEGSWPEGITTTDVVVLLEKAHSLQARPCGRAISYLISRWHKVNWPQSALEILCWYATEDPDPEDELWRSPAASGKLYFGGDPEKAGLNSTRGGAARAIASLLYARHKFPSLYFQPYKR